MTNTLSPQNDGYSKKELLEIIEEIDADQKQMEYHIERQDSKKNDPYAHHPW